MLLITGGAYQGKLMFAKSICKSEHPVIVEGELEETEQLYEADIISHFHLYIRRLLKEGKEPEKCVEKLLKRNPDVIFEITQLGCGVVPVDAFDRRYREKVGRISCMLARQAEQVWMVNAGIGMRLK